METTILFPVCQQKVLADRAKWLSSQTHSKERPSKRQSMLHPKSSFINQRDERKVMIYRDNEICCTFKNCCCTCLIETNVSYIFLTGGDLLSGFENITSCKNHLKDFPIIQRTIHRHLFNGCTVLYTHNNVSICLHTDRNLNFVHLDEGL